MTGGTPVRIAAPAPGRHDRALARLGIQPSLGDRVAAILDGVIADAERRTSTVAVLDAGCGHRSPLRRFRSRIAYLAGVDLHAPAAPLRYLDTFATVDLCAPDAAIPGGPFDVAVSNFTFEHFDEPANAIASLHRALRDGGSLVVVTVNRRHPFVAVYLSLPARLRDRLQRGLKATPADAHRLVGACNDPEAISTALRKAGFERIELETVSNLGRSWGRHALTFLLGALGDRLWHGTPDRRSTIIAVARKRGPAQPAPSPASATPPA